LGIHQGPYYEIRDGLKEGDLVVVMGQQRLFDGASVITEEEK
jgi:multidrug efflux pump subunit AcrA (membrane-fusion protein)